MQNQFLDAQEKIESLLRFGRVGEAQKILAQFDDIPIPRPYVETFAGLARKAFCANRGLIYLHPIVRASDGVDPARDSEIAEYAACLSRIGAHAEALTLLATIDLRNVPQAYFLKVSALLAQFRYSDAVPVIEALLGRSDIADNIKMFAATNLASTYLALGQTERALTLLADLRKTTNGLKWTFVRGTVLALNAQAEIESKNWGLAESLIADAEKIVRGLSGEPAYFSREWGGYLKLLKSNGSKSAVRAVSELRREAWKLNLREICRRSDRMLGMIRNDEDLLNHLYHGTPSSDFRRRLVNDFSPCSVADHYLWKLKGEPKSANALAVDDPKFPNRLVAALSRDFYRWIKLSVADAGLSGEVYHPVKTPERVKNAVAKLRRWVTAKKLPLKILVRDDSFQLSATRHFGLRLATAD